MIDHSTPEAQALFEREVRRRTDPPFCMSRTQAEMLVAVLMWQPAKSPSPDDYETE